MENDDRPSSSIEIGPNKLDQFCGDVRVTIDRDNVNLRVLLDFFMYVVD